MPIYEYYCPRCNMIFNFLARTVNPRRQPRCPRCGKPRLQRVMSTFSTMRTSGREDAENGDLPLDEDRLERAVSALENEVQGVDENDPRAAARFMKRFSEATGLEFGETMREIVGRMEAGEEPERIEEELGDVADSDEEPFVIPEKRGGAGVSGRRPPPRRDETLYDL